MWHFLRKVCNLYVFGPHSSHGNTRGRDFSIKLSIFRLSTRVTKYSFTHCVSASFTWTCRFGPSICITLTFFWVPQNVMDPLMDVIWCDLRSGMVKYTHYSGCSIRIATITLFSFTHSLAQYIHSALAHMTAFHFPFRRITLLRTLLPSRKLSAHWTRTNVLCF